MSECVGNAGLIFKRGDADDLYRCMVRIISNKDLAQRLREDAKVQVERFQESRLASIYIDIYENVYKGKRVEP